MATWKECKRFYTSSSTRGCTGVARSLRERPKQRVRCSALFLPRTQPDSQQATAPSHKLLLGAGLIRQSSAGVYHLLPLGMRVFERLVAIVDYHMQAIGGSKMALPILTPATQWKASGRWDSVGAELFRLKGSTGSEYCLAPTHEESVTELVGSEVTSHRQLPLRLYQLDRKFRDEKRPRYGLLRCKEFWMKDMYTFDVSEEEAIDTYQDVCGAYERIFNTLSLPVIKVKAASGNIGGTLSHEYHVTSSVGEDTLVLCHSCGGGYNKELLSTGAMVEHGRLPDCRRPVCDCDLEDVRGIEVAHTFYLGTKYSSVFGASFSDTSNTEQLCQMGCYGIGISRLLQATLQHSCNSHHHDNISWPLPIAPYLVCVLPLTTSQDPSDPLMVRAHRLYDRLSEEVCPDRVILDDRTHLSMGARIRDSRLLGYPCTVIIGHKTSDGEYEVAVQAESGADTRLVTETQLIHIVTDLHSHSNTLKLKH